MKTMFSLSRLGYLLLLLLAVSGLAGCSTTDADSDNVAARPWNSPKGWENGLPSSVTEGH